MNEPTDDIFFDEDLFDPYNITADQTETIRHIARGIIERQKVCYTKGIILAYIEWLSIARVEKLRH